MKILIIGAGIFGVVSSLVLSEDTSHEVTLIEKTNDILTKASRCNHNRLHLGYHYPRSIETAQQSLIGMSSFFVNFKEAINTSFDNYYMIEKNGKVTADEYIKFCDELNVGYKKQWPSIKINSKNLDLSIVTQEPVFDFDIIKSILKRKLSNSRINLILNTEVKTKEICEPYDVIINSTYASLNDINTIFNLEPIIMRFQDVVVPILEIKIPSIGVTIMDGPYCSVMPMGFSTNKFLLYHAKYSVLNEQLGTTFKNDNYKFCYETLLKKSLEYFEFLTDAKYIDCYRTIRALPVNNNDARVTLKEIQITNNKKIINIISGKISTCWSTAYELKRMLK